jgi:hypothetical protein
VPVALQAQVGGAKPVDGAHSRSGAPKVSRHKRTAAPTLRSTVPLKRVYITHGGATVDCGGGGRRPSENPVYKASSSHAKPFFGWGGYPTLSPHFRAPPRASVALTRLPFDGTGTRPSGVDAAQWVPHRHRPQRQA